MEFSLKTSESFDEVMRHYTPTVYRIAFTRLGNAADAEDVSQNVFVKYFKADITFESEEHRKAWLLRCAVNCANSFASSAWYRHNRDTDDPEQLLESIPDGGSVEGAAELLETREGVLNAVMKLPPKYRTVIFLFYFEDLSTAQISSVIKARESTVRSQLSRARELLKKMLKEAEFDEV